MDLDKYVSSIKQRHGITDGKRFLFVATEKHETRYYHCESTADVLRAALKVLTDRFEDDWYEKPERPEDVGITAAHIDLLPEGAVKAMARETLRDFQRQLKEYENDLSEWQEIDQAVKEKDGRLAIYILMQRRSNEYERIDFEDYDEVV